MSPMTMIESRQKIGMPILTIKNDEKFGEEIAAFFIAHANSLGQPQGLSDLCVGALVHPSLPGLIYDEALRPSSKGGEF